MSTTSATMPETVAITLPGPPVPFAIAPERLRAWLTQKRWEPGNNPAKPYWHFTDPRQAGYAVNVPKDAHGPDAERHLRRAVIEAAKAEGLDELALAAELQGPIPADAATAWAMLPSARRERALATITKAVEQKRDWAGRLRRAGDPERAQAFEDEAAALAAIMALGGRGR